MPTFAIPKIYKPVLKKKEFLNEKTLYLTFGFVDNNIKFKFVPGQFVNIKVGENIFRSYSVCSDYRNTWELSIVATIAHDGVGSNYLKSLKVGDKIEFVGPSGRYHLREKLPTELLFLATGSGLAPFLAMFYQLEQQNYSGEINLYFGVRNQKELFSLDTLNEFSKNLQNFHYHVCLSDPDASWTGNKGRITDFFKFKDASKTYAFLCGNPFMIEESVEKLISYGLTESQIFYEKFLHATQPVIKTIVAQ